MLARLAAERDLLYVRIMSTPETLQAAGCKSSVLEISMTRGTATRVPTQVARMTLAPITGSVANNARTGLDTRMSHTSGNAPLSCDAFTARNGLEIRRGGIPRYGHCGPGSCIGLFLAGPRFDRFLRPGKPGFVLLGRPWPFAREACIRGRAQMDIRGEQCLMII